MTAQVSANIQSPAPLPLRTLLAVVLSLGISAAIFAIPDLSLHAKVAFVTFALAIIAWTMTDLNDTYVALGAAIVFAATGIDEPNEFFETLGDPLIWLLFASFLIAAAIKASGLSERMAFAVTRRARTVQQLFILVSVVLVATTFLIPSTSGRAALMLPVFVALRALMPNEHSQKALALLFPAVILLSAIASLIGAGAHLITADILWRTGGEYIGFGRWMLMGLPFAVASSIAAMIVIMWMFMRKEDRSAPLQTAAAQNASAWSGKERIVAMLAGGLVLLWATETAHGVSSTIIAILGALLLTAPLLNVISFKNALKEVDWSMLVFMAATLELGEALIESGGAQWLVENVFGIFQTSLFASPLMVVSLVALFGLLSHLVITSRSSRASVIIPLVIFLAIGLGFSPTTFAFMTAAATGFCLTLPVSAKPVAMFSKVEGATYAPSDLLRLSGVLLPIHLVLLVLFAFLIWPALGLDVAQAAPEEERAPLVWYDNPSKNLLPSVPLINLGENAHKDPTSPSDPNFAPSGSGADTSAPASIDGAISDWEAQQDLLEAQQEGAEAALEAQLDALEAQQEAAEEAQEAQAGAAVPAPTIAQAGAPPPAVPPQDEDGDGEGDGDGDSDGDGD
jgi:solute carrier family 13 (sodium-dependent dicarboxylate transporter), member 2/3/5